MNNQGYILLEVLLLLFILVIIMNSLLPILDSSVKILERNKIDDDLNTIILNISQALRNTVRKKSEVELYNLDMNKLIHKFKSLESVEEKCELKYRNRIYILDIDKKNLGENLWEVKLVLKEEGYGKENKTRLIFEKEE